MKACFLPSIYRIENFQKTTIEQILQDIKNEKYKNFIDALPDSKLFEKEYKEKKLLLPSFVLNGDFDKKISNDSFIESSGLFHFDIDDLDDVLEVKNKIIAQIPEIYSLWLSPSKKGLKGLIRIPDDFIKNDEEFKIVYHQIEALFLSFGHILDKSCKDVRRLCFVSSDKDIYINEQADCLIVNKEKPVRNQSAVVPINGPSSKIIDRCCNIIFNSRHGDHHAARLRAGELAGGYIATGQINEYDAIEALERASELISLQCGDKQQIIDREKKAIKDGIEHGKSRPLAIDQNLPNLPNLPILPKPNIDWLNGDELAETASAPNFLINDIIESKTNGLIAGSSQSFKSFCVLKMAHSICTGNDFFEHEVFTIGKVLYICGEGMGALGRRIKALKIVSGDFNNNFFVLNRPLFIDSNSEMEWLKGSINKINPVFVIFDTFSSLAISTKENVNEEVARVLRMVSDCCLYSGSSSIVVHHYGKDSEKGVRGASAFSANVDYEISMKRVPDSLNAVMSCKKSKDGDYFEDINITAHIVDIGLVRQDGKTATSLVLKKEKDDGFSLTEKQNEIFKVICELIQEDGIFVNGKNLVTKEQIKKCFIKKYSKDKNKYTLFDKYIPVLKKKLFIFEENDYFYVMKKSDLPKNLPGVEIIG